MKHLKKFNENFVDRINLSELIQFLENINDILNPHRDEYDGKISLVIINPEDSKSYVVITNDVKLSMELDPNFFTYNYHREVIISISFGDYTSSSIIHRKMVDDIFNRLNIEYPKTFRIDNPRGLRLIGILSCPIKY
jgi:hypothetical protein